MQLVVTEVHVADPGEAVAVYPVIAEPPVDAGAVQVSDTCESPVVPVRAVGAPGTVRGVIADEADDAEPGPAAFVATTVKVYAVPFDNPVTVQPVAVVVQVAPPGEAVAV